MRITFITFITISERHDYDTRACAYSTCVFNYRLFSKMGDYCCGCGNDVTEKRNKRRLLSSAKSQHVLSVWNGFLDKFSVSLGELSPGYLCKSCFSTYERYINLQRSIEENLDFTTSSNET